MTKPIKRTKTGQPAEHFVIVIANYDRTKVMALGNRSGKPFANKAQAGKSLTAIKASIVHLPMSARVLTITPFNNIINEAEEMGTDEHQDQN